MIITLPSDGKKINPRGKTSNSSNFWRKECAFFRIKARGGGKFHRLYTGYDSLRSFLRKNEAVSSQAQLGDKPTPMEYNPLKMYLSCLGIVFIWITTGTLFYSYYNNWPLAQSFFYAVDAGMSIGFCTEVYEIKLFSKAFTIIYILLGASVVGGALALFIQDAVEGISMPSVQEYHVMLERKVFEKANVSRTGVLTYDEFRELIRFSNDGDQLTESDIQQLFKKFDRLKDGIIHFEEFSGTFRNIGSLVKFIKRKASLSPIKWLWIEIRLWLDRAWRLENRIYFVCCSWILMGILWGIFDQKWDPITATHFSVSALATGGLTAPHVNSEGILPTRPAIFCGVFCLLGIPLFAFTLGHFARFLVSHHIAAMERKSLTRPLSRAEFDLAKNLTTRDSNVHLSDFIVLQLLRQGKISAEIIQVLKQNFEVLDVEKKGYLTIQEARSK